MKPNGEFKIEDNVPIPSYGNQGKGYTAVLRKLRKGQCVFLPTRIQSIQSCIHQMGATMSDFTCRSEGSGVRVWRITAQRTETHR